MRTGINSKYTLEQKTGAKQMSFQKLGLIPELLSAITARGYKIATPIQAQSIPPILAGRDVMAGAQTGTGKTAAFSLPILQTLKPSKKPGRNPRALILTPTRELAAQVVEFTQEYGKSLTLSATAIFGGVSIRPQKSRLKQGVDILVATPGRLLDHATQKTVNLSEVEILVLDEADRMMDMGFSVDLNRIIKLVPQKRQNLLFSATYSTEIKKLADKMLHRPVLIEVSTRNTAATTVSQVVHPVQQKDKHKLLYTLILDGKWEQVLVFTRTKHGANNLVKKLILDDISATAIHGNKSQAARTRALADFKSGKLRVLVATDIAARGLDINLLPHVVNFELPDTPDNYIHRIGRTGRAGVNGKAVSLVCPEENYELHQIHKLLNKKIPIEKIEGFDAILLTTKGAPRRSGGNQNKSRVGSRGGNSNRSRTENPNKSKNNPRNLRAKGPDTKIKRSKRPSTPSEPETNTRWSKRSSTPKTAETKRHPKSSTLKSRQKSINSKPSAPGKSSKPRKKIWKNFNKKIKK